MATGREAEAGYEEGGRGASTHRRSAAPLAGGNPTTRQPHCRLSLFWPTQAFRSSWKRRLLTLQLWWTVEIKHCRRPDLLDCQDSEGPTGAPRSGLAAKQRAIV